MAIQLLSRPINVNKHLRCGNRQMFMLQGINRGKLDVVCSRDMYTDITGLAGHSNAKIASKGTGTP